MFFAIVFRKGKLPSECSAVNEDKKEVKREERLRRKFIPFPCLLALFVSSLYECAEVI